MSASGSSLQYHTGRSAAAAAAAAAAAKLLQSCPTLCNPIDSSPLGSPACCRETALKSIRRQAWMCIQFSSVQLLSPV